MRWFWIDRFDELMRFRYATATKAVTLAEEHLHDHFPGAPLVPNSLVLEGLAQTSGLLVADALDYARQVVLAKVGRAVFHFDVVPGDVLTFRAEIGEFSDAGSSVRATGTVAGRLQSEADLVFGHLETGVDVPRLFTTGELMRWLDSVRIPEVARHEDGTPARRDRLAGTVVDPTGETAGP